VIVLGFDTATAATAVALRSGTAPPLEARDDPAPGAHPGHATRLLSMAGELLAGAGVSWSELDRLAVGVGPGTFTGLRVGVTTARGLAQALELQLTAVSSLAALAHAALAHAALAHADGRHVLALIDARRGEVFAAVYAPGVGVSPEQATEPRALAPELVPELLEAVGDNPAGLAERAGDGGRSSVLAVGDGAERYRELLQDAGLELAPAGSPLHRVSAASICALGALAVPLGAVEELVPDYRRRPDAELSSTRSPVGSGA